MECFAAVSNGERVENPKHYRAAKSTQESTAHRYAPKEQAQQPTPKAINILARKHLHIKRQRADFHHKTALDVIRRYDHITIEDLNVRGMVRNHHLAKASVTRAGTTCQDTHKQSCECWP
ncbi:MAG: transposase [Acidobacteria bacterium]|nr:transposase [Acidobacteriota bacterium]